MLSKCMLDTLAQITRAKHLFHEDRILIVMFPLILFRCRTPDI